MYIFLAPPVFHASIPLNMLFCPFVGVQAPHPHPSPKILLFLPNVFLQKVFSASPFWFRCLSSILTCSHPSQVNFLQSSPLECTVIFKGHYIHWFPFLPPHYQNVSFLQIMAILYGTWQSDDFLQCFIHACCPNKSIWKINIFSFSFTSCNLANLSSVVWCQPRRNFTRETLTVLTLDPCYDF